MVTNPAGGGELARLLEKHRDELERDWCSLVLGTARGRMTKAEIERELSPLLDSLLAGVDAGGTDASGPAFDDARAMLRELSAMRARAGFSPSETASAVLGLKDLLLSREKGADVETYDCLLAFSKLVDSLALVTFEAFAQAREAVIAEQAEQLLELSTPVVKLWEDVIAVPLVGTLDSARTQVVMESLLGALVSTGSGHAIIDITGVPAVDTQVAQHILKTVVAARLMGAECVISGIRPQIAQTIVALGIDFGDIVTKASLADALRLTLRRAGLEVRRTNGQ